MLSEYGVGVLGIISSLLSSSLSSSHLVEQVSTTPDTGQHVVLNRDHVYHAGVKFSHITGHYLSVQVFCIVVNLSCGSAQTRDKLAENSQLMEAISLQLVSVAILRQLNKLAITGFLYDCVQRKPGKVGVLMSACTVVRHLADVIVNGMLLTTY